MYLPLHCWSKIDNLQEDTARMRKQASVCSNLDTETEMNFEVPDIEIPEVNFEADFDVPDVDLNVSGIWTNQQTLGKGSLNFPILLNT